MPELSIKAVGKSGEQVFKGDDWEEVATKLAKAQEHASRLIRRQSKQLAKLRDMLEQIATSLIMSKLGDKIGIDLEADKGETAESIASEVIKELQLDEPERGSSK